MTQPKVFVAPVLFLLILAGCIMVQGSVAVQNRNADPFRYISSIDPLKGYTSSDNSQGAFRNQLANNSFSGAYFTGNPLEGDAPLTVAFMDLSAQTGEAWYWDFGDGGSSQEQNPVHTFTVPGTYSITLTITRKVSHPGSQYEFSSTITRDDYIVVHGIAPTPVPTFTPGSTIPVLTPRYTPSSQGLTITPSLITIRPISPGSAVMVPSVSSTIASHMARYAFVSGSIPDGITSAPGFSSVIPVLPQKSHPSPLLIRP